MKIGSIDIELWSIPGTTGAGPAAVDTKRMIEVPLGLWFLQQFSPAVIEVGAVTPYFLTALNTEIKHPVFDPYDTWSGCIRKYANELNYDGKNLLSISTIEHICHGEYGQASNGAVAVDILRQMLRAEHYLITWPVHWHADLDRYAELLSGPNPFIKLHRTGYREWTRVASLKGIDYGKEGGGSGPYPFGNGIYVATNCEELLS